MQEEFAFVCAELEVRYGPFEPPIAESLARYVSPDPKQPEELSYAELREAAALAKIFIMNRQGLEEFRARRCA